MDGVDYAVELYRQGYARRLFVSSACGQSREQALAARVADQLNEVGQAVNGSRILVLGVAYKPDVADVRESPALEIIRLLEARGAQVSFHDPLVTSLRDEGLQTPRIELTAEALDTTDCVVIATDHSHYNWDWIQQHARLIVDTRYALGPDALRRWSPLQLTQ